MQLKMKPRLLTRIFFTSLSIIALVGFGLAALVNVLHKQNGYNVETAALIAEIPSVAAELKQSRMLPENSQWLESNQQPQRYIMASCNSQFQQIWTSSRASELGLFQACEKFNAIRHSSPPYLLSFANNTDYYAYLLSVELDGKHYNLLVMKNAARIQQENSEFSNRTYLRLAMVMSLAIVLLISAAYWGMRPLARMRGELQAINNGNASALSEDYPVELEGITHALNQLLQQSANQQLRYQTAMDDLAHSLKTRLAAVHAITDDTQLSKQQMSERIMEQIGQMDLLVKYQLKRAMLGRRGLKHETTLLLPVIHAIVQMMDKVYRDKQVQITINISDELHFPGTEGDLLELCGNLLENAFRLCISQISISATSNQNEPFYFIIDDDGPGVPPALREQILQRGVRADSRSPGQGIGLAVCSEIVASYNGTLSVETSPLEGARFTICLPR
ncbi:sensor histidine kinase [Shewanella sp. NFH-SH190041]|uniref:ATP-binding protein n=1 Tax=Shewanella sp. NFH-SH190041 TaxID=2950245 RepID=UPI0021C43613|nr:ATP-binding protein [Shewanella sp. NFH-SH190041]BDM64700.1 sensor histidine kinase [Shewanella sp. NFH-SH190041]